MGLLQIIVRNMLRKPVRLVLTIIPMCLAFFGFSLIVGIDNACDVEFELDDKRRIVTINRQSITQPLMQPAIERVRKMPQVNDATFVTWFGGYFLKPDQTFSQYAIEEDNYFAVFDGIQVPDTSLPLWKEDPTAVLVTPVLAERFDWKTGDKIILTTSIWTQKNFSSDWPFTIAGIFYAEDGTEEESMLIKHTYLERNRLFGRGMTSFFVSRIRPEYDVNNTITQLDNLFENSKSPTFTSKESAFAESFRRQLGDLALMTKLVLAIAVLVVFLLTSSSMAQSLVERKRELALFSAVGYSKRKISSLLVIENILVVVLAMLIATCITFVSSWILGQILVDGPFSDIELRFWDIVQITAIAISLGATGATLPLLKLLKEDLSANLKSAI
ncbi:FtsX-like permease family protein [Pseudoalteromonas sp. SG41-1]|uniref:ABC transporter permease n=1 Tax=Pseudoalteromonas sp. SG41-1 TaxID=2760979 RepID=UPI0015FEF3D1|nr:FtsX-like permease family protein [Pseudoalteromonas sp. SG41-1]MBB1507830.1 FtsX-like permease family protein [Pseudoalteromonas sp. SG41-1]